MQSAMPAITPVTTAPFLAAHLGELTRILTPELVDDVLAATRKVQKRIRLLPSRAVVYFLLALPLFGEWGYRGVWSELTAALGADAVDPSAAALRHARRRIGLTPLRMLLDRLRGGLSTADTPGSRWRGLTVVAFDGTTLAVPASTANSAFFGHGAGGNGIGGYALTRLTALVECGTRACVDAVSGPLADDEISQATRMLGSLTPGMLVLGDKNFDSYELIRDIHHTGARPLLRARAQRVLPVIAALPDGSWISFIPQPGTPAARCAAWRAHGGLPPQVPGIWIRVITATITVTTGNGTRTDSTLRLLTTLLDHQRHPAQELAELYQQRWEIETAFYGLKTTLRGPDRVLRSHTPAGVEQEVLAHLITYQALRAVLCQAATHAGLDPDRLSFTVAVRSARQSVSNADFHHRTQCCTCPCHPPHRMTTQLLNPRNLHPAQRRPRTSARTVKRPYSAYAYRDKTNRHKQRMTTTIIITPPQQPALTPAGTG